jgi:hypothetical protein
LNLLCPLYSYFQTSTTVLVAWSRCLGCCSPFLVYLEMSGSLFIISQSSQ